MMLKVFVVDLRYLSQLLSCSFGVLEEVVSRETFIYHRTSNFEAFPDVYILNHEGFVAVLKKTND